MSAGSFIPQWIQQTPDWVRGGVYGVAVCAICFFAFSKRKKPSWASVLIFFAGLGLLLFSLFGKQHPQFKLLIRNVESSAVSSDANQTNKTWVLIEAGILNSGEPSIALNWNLRLVFKDGETVQMFNRMINTNVFITAKERALRRLDEVVETNDVGRIPVWGWLSFSGDVDYFKFMSELESCDFLLSVEDRDARRFQIKKPLKDLGPKTRLK